MSSSYYSSFPTIKSFSIHIWQFTVLYSVPRNTHDMLIMMCHTQKWQLQRVSALTSVNTMWLSYLMSAVHYTENDRCQSLLVSFCLTYVLASWAWVVCSIVKKCTTPNFLTFIFSTYKVEMKVNTMTCKLGWFNLANMLHLYFQFISPVLPQHQRGDNLNYPNLACFKFLPFFAGGRS